MKKLSIIFAFALSWVVTLANTNLSSMKGVWASDNAEAVITDSVCIFIAKADSTMQATLLIPSEQFYHWTAFEKDGSVSSSRLQSPLEINLVGDELEISGMLLRKVENVEIVAPYEMPECKSKFDVGKCLQEWRLGARYSANDDMPYCEINTNRHMFVYLINPSMVSISGRLQPAITIMVPCFFRTYA